MFHLGITGLNLLNNTVRPKFGDNSDCQITTRVKGSNGRKVAN
jgi:hypothetical protein